MRKLFLLVALMVSMLLGAMPVFADTTIMPDIMEVGTLEEAKNLAKKQMGRITVPVSVKTTDEYGNTIYERSVKEVENVVVITTLGKGNYKVINVGARAIKENDPYFEDKVEETLSNCAWLMIDYPTRELIYINNIPWQNTKYRDYVIEEVKRQIPFYPNGILNKDKTAWEIFLNPKYNGKAATILDPKTKEDEEYSKKVLKEIGSEENNINKPDNLEKPYNTKLIMKLGDNKVVVAREGSTEKVNTLQVKVEAINGVALIPLTGVIDEFGSTLEYNKQTKEVTIKNENTTIVLKENSKIAKVNDKNKTMNYPMKIKNGRTLIPLRFVSESLGYTINFNKLTNEIVIIKN